MSMLERMQAHDEQANKSGAPKTLPCIGVKSRAGQMYTLLRSMYPYPVGLTQLESIAYTKVTQRMANIRTALKPLGWEPKNELTYVGKQVYSTYRLVKL